MDDFWQEVTVRSILTLGSILITIGIIHGVAWVWVRSPGFVLVSGLILAMSFGIGYWSTRRERRQ